MHFYTVEVTPLPNWKGPLWHFAVFAAFPDAAIASLRQADDIPSAAKMRIIPRL